MKKVTLPRKFISLCKSVSAKRAKTVIEHILKHGFITTEELKEKYGYNHPPRAIRDVKEHGIPIQMYRIQGSDGRSIAAYKFGDPSKMRFSKLKGRTLLSKELKRRLLDIQGSKCAIYLEAFQANELQIDHRIPFEISGDDPNGDTDPKDYMLLSASANRAKSWSCEHCVNWLNIRKPSICKKCYWAYPEDYSHIALRQIRRLDIMWIGNEDVKIFEQLKRKTKELQKEMPAYVKEIVKLHIRHPS